MLCVHESNVKRVQSSQDYGNGAWTQQVGAPTTAYWLALASDATGRYLVGAVYYGGAIYTNQVGLTHMLISSAAGVLIGHIIPLAVLSPLYLNVLSELWQRSLDGTDGSPARELGCSCIGSQR
jgi:hypothetical protein